MRVRARSTSTYDDSFLFWFWCLLAPALRSRRKSTPSCRKQATQHSQAYQITSTRPHLYEGSPSLHDGFATASPASRLASVAVYHVDRYTLHQSYPTHTPPHVHSKPDYGHLQPREAPFYTPLIDFLYQSGQRIHRLLDKRLEGHLNASRVRHLYQRHHIHRRKAPIPRHTD